MPHGRSKVFAVNTERTGKKDPHFEAIYVPRHSSCSMQSPGPSKGDALAAMWYPSKKDNDQLKELSLVVAQMIQVQLN